MERTLVLLKPDTLQRHLVGEILHRFERKNLKIVALKMLQMTPELTKIHYKTLAHEPFFPEIEAYITSGPLIALILEGLNAIQVVRNLVGPTDGSMALPGTIRGDYTPTMRQNLVHASDSPEAVQEEIKRFFPNEKEIF